MVSVFLIPVIIFKYAKSSNIEITSPTGEILVIISMISMVILVGILYYVYLSDIMVLILFSKIRIGPIIYYTFLGSLGGLTMVIVNSNGWADLTTLVSCRRYVVGIICGFINYVLCTYYSFPNSIMTWVMGYMGNAFVEGLIYQFSIDTNKDSNS